MQAWWPCGALDWFAAPAGAGENENNPACLGHYAIDARGSKGNMAFPRGTQAP